MIHTDKTNIGTYKGANRSIKLLPIAGVAILAIALLGGCVKEVLYKTLHPNSGAVHITTVWSELSEDAVRPENYLLRIGDTIQNVSAPANVFKKLLPQGIYSLLLHNMPQGITVGAPTATVNTLADGTLHPTPGYLFSAIQELFVLNDDTLKVNVNMRQIGRKLTLLLKLRAGDADRIASSSATLTGVAHTVHLATGQLTSGQAGGTVAPAFVKTSVAPLRTADSYALAAPLQLVGVVQGERQLFKIIITLTDGTTTTMESDLTEALVSFSTGKNPLTLDAELPLPEEGSFSGTITGWTEIDNEDVTIH